MSITSHGCAALEACIERFITDLKKHLSSLEDVSRFEFTIEAEGRLDGDTKLTYKFSTNYNLNVTSGSIFPLIAEATRRSDWNRRHQPICLPNVPATPDEPIELPSLDTVSKE